MPILDLITRRATFAPSTLDREAGTVEAVLSTGADVRRSGFIERLSIGPENVTLAARLPVLDAHRQSSISDIKGRVEGVRFEGGSITATLRISDLATLDAIERGDVTGVSIGYRVGKWAETTDPATRARVRTATSWELLEVSLVPIPADPAATVRSIPVETETTETEIAAPAAVSVETRAAIRQIARSAGLDTDWADARIDSGCDVTATRAAAFEAMQTRSETIRTATVGASSEDPAVIRQRQTEALAARMGGPEAGDAARPFMAWGLADYARDHLARDGSLGVSMLSGESVISRAMHTTADFSELLTGAGNRVLASGYQSAQSPLKSVARQRSASDFRPLSILRFGEFNRLAKVTEHGEITALSNAETKEGFSLETFGGTFALSRKALINDDLGAMGRWSAEMGRAAAETEADQLLSLLLSNPAMSDGTALFHADHGNLAASGGALDIDSLDAARLAMRMQKGLDGVTPVNMRGRYLLIDPTQETAAEKLLASLTAHTVADQNPFAGSLTILVEPRLPAGAWYVFADPAMAAVMEYAYLTSAPGPQMSSRDGWEVLGREFRVVLDFGCGVTDWRGAYRNAGA